MSPSKPLLHLPPSRTLTSSASPSLSTHAAPATCRHLRLVQPRACAHLASIPHLSDPSLSRLPSSPSPPSAENPRSPSLSIPLSPCAEHQPPSTTLHIPHLAPLSSPSASLSHAHGLPPQRILSVPLSQPDSHSQELSIGESENGVSLRRRRKKERNGEEQLFWSPLISQGRCHHRHGKPLSQPFLRRIPQDRNCWSFESSSRGILSLCASRFQS
ncbi:hypothetical protein AAC387_Pa04g3044 [Persea americana]